MKFCKLMPAIGLAVALTAPAQAHLHWTQTNVVDSSTLALYHFDDTWATTATMAAAPLPANRALVPLNTSPPVVGYAAPTPGVIFDPGALRLSGTQTLRTTETLTGLSGDLTIEAWFKWTPDMTSSTLEIGLQSGARILIARDAQNPANDRFGVAGTHGSFVSAAGFMEWPTVGEEEASLDEWRHVALAIHSAGITYDAQVGHDVYLPGTVGRIYLNGHPVGSFPFTMDLAGLKVHGDSTMTVISRGGGTALDELTLWSRDWTENGAVDNPFANGRGSASVDDWTFYR